MQKKLLHCICWLTLILKCIFTIQSFMFVFLFIVNSLHMCIKLSWFWAFFLLGFRRNFLSSDDAELMVKLLGLSAVLHGQQYGRTGTLGQVLNKKKIFINKTFPKEKVQTSENLMGKPAWRILVRCWITISLQMQCAMAMTNPWNWTGAIINTIPPKVGVLIIVVKSAV